VRRERVSVAAHPDRVPELRAALEALGAVPIDYAGTVHDRRGNPVMRVITPATVDALIAAVDRVREIVNSRQCPPGTELCGPCSRLSQAWQCWQVGAPFYPEVPAGDDPETIVLPDPERDRGIAAPEWGEEARRALAFALHSGAWPDKYVHEWRWWFDRL
jgi:hypothetical protein